MRCDKSRSTLHDGSALGTDILRPGCIIPCCVETGKMIDKLIFTFVVATK